MKLIIKEVHLHHFMSFDDATIDLTNKGYCLISGENKNPKDAAKSNGSGKSTIFNAISYALTGETLQSLKSNLANIYFNDGCYVELEFNVNNDNYKLIRSRDDKTYGTNLKIYVNGEDKSGKGIRESQEIVDTYLPDLTSELIGSVIILGQGLPQKFTSNTPSGRKEVLEHLSKSDFMIQDLKDRIEKRQNELAEKYNKNNNDIISITSQLDVYKEQYSNKEEELKNYQKEINYDDDITRLQNEYENNLKIVESARADFNYWDKLYKDKLTEYGKLSVTMSEQKIELEREHSKISLEFTQKISIKNNDISNLNAEITKLKSITDICPTCGQKIPNVIKPDTSKQEKEVLRLKEELEAIKSKQEEDDKNYNEAISQLNASWRESFDKCDLEKSECCLKASNAEKSKLEAESLSNKLLAEVSNLVNLKNTFETNKKKLEDELNNLSNSITKLTSDLDKCKENENNLTLHINAISKMNTLIKRDFRGILLQDIINYIDAKMKEYSSKIFATDEISLTLDGNSVDITFCNKDFENLSGGEKQRVDIIVQFAIRQMMCKYLNFSSNILVLDEITDALDSVSCDKVLNFITNELNDIESVFIISHHSDELQIPSDYEIVVTKDIHGVSTITKQ